MTDKAKNILARLEDAGFKSYVVGGFVRDMVMGKNSTDIDIATEARPEQIKKVFACYKLVDIGQRFGTIKVIDGKESFEITSFREEKSYRDKRHPEKISFAKTIEEDLSRRDFTINAMAIRNARIIDPFGGKIDIEKKIIRAVDDPYKRIGEDYLRALRAVRFASILGFEIEADLKKAIKYYNKNIAYISKERIKDEFSKIIICQRPDQAIRLMDELGLLGQIFPEIERLKGFDQHSIHHYLDVYDHTLEVLKNTPEDLVARLAGLFHDVGKPHTFFLDESGQGRFFGHQNISKDICEKRLRDLRFSKITIEDVGLLIKRHMDAANTYTEKSVARLFRKLGEENLIRLLDLQAADKLATNNKDLSNIENARKILYDLKNKDIPKSRKDLAIDGHDLIKLGYKEGKDIGKILKLVEENVFYGSLANNKDDILDFIRSKAPNLDR